MRPEVMGDIGQQAWRLVARRLDDVALERSQGGLHQCAPRVLIPCLGRLLQQDIVADRLNRYEAKATGKGFILGSRDILRHHSLRQALCLLSAVGDDRFFHTKVDPLLCSIGGTHKAIEPRHLQKETDQPNATRPDFDKDHMER